MKLKKSAIIAIISFLNTIIISTLSLVFTNLVLKNYGSDYNGIVASVMQIMTVLLVLEGGITYASNYSMYKPYMDDNYDKINEVLYKTKKQFIKIGILIFIFGLLISFIYPLIVKSNLDYFNIFFIILFVVISTSFNIFFTTKMNVLFQTSQKEYITGCISLFVNILVYILIIILAFYKANMLIIRFTVMLGTIIIGILTYVIFKKVFPKASFNQKCDSVKIEGSRDIIVQRFTGIIYTSFPMLFMSSTIGTIYTSVYSVYNSIFNIIKTILYSLVSAPSNGFGQLFATESKKKVYKKFEVYNILVIVILTCLLSSVLSVIVPFVELYTANVIDVNYVDETLAILFALNIFFEMIHTPSGTIISVSGHFKEGKKIQIIAMCILIPSLLVGAFVFKLYGIMVSLVITSFFLAIMEIFFAYKKIFQESLIKVSLICLINLCFIIIQYYIWKFLNINFSSYFQFLLYGLFVFITNSILTLTINFVLFKDLMLNIKSMVLSIISRKKA